MFDPDRETLAKRYKDERQFYEELTNHVQSLLKSETRHRGIVCSVESRVKELHSFLKKALRKNYDSPFDDIRDIAGVRVIVIYEEALADVKKIIRQLFDVREPKNKDHSLNYNQLGYQAIHFEIGFSKPHLKSYQEKYQDMVCEVQLHTRAQNLWSNVSHELLYKVPQQSPPKIQRIIYRLVALIELFDNEVRRARKHMLKQPGFPEAKMLDQLERNFYRFTTRSFDAELSVKIISVLKQLLSPAEIKGFKALLEDFVDRKKDKLEEIFHSYSNDEHYLLLSQPESLLIFERLDKDKFYLKEVWREVLPLSLLEPLTDIWGKSIIDLD